MLMPKANSGYVIEGVWPTVRDDDWCGEWKILPRRPAVAAVPVHGYAPPAQVVNLPAMAAD